MTTARTSLPPPVRAALRAHPYKLAHHANRASAASKMSNTSTRQTAHVESQMPSTSRAHTPPPGLLTFEVEKVVGRRIKGDRLEYQLKLKNFPPSFNSWVCASHCVRCLNLVFWLTIQILCYFRTVRL